VDADSRTPVTEYVADTHALIWHEETSPRLSGVARACFEVADKGNARILIPAISVVEMIYLAEKGRIAPTVAPKTLASVTPAGGSFELVPLDERIIAAVNEIPRDRVTDLPDKLIVATAYALGLPLITVDDVITKSGLVPVVW